jgi:hypothetical protein
MENGNNPIISPLRQAMILRMPYWIRKGPSRRLRLQVEYLHELAIMTAVIGLTPGTRGQVPMDNHSKHGSWTVSSVDLPAKSVTTTKQTGLS